MMPQVELGTLPWPCSRWNPRGFAGEDRRILVAQFTTEGTMSGQIQIQVYQEGDQSQEFRDLLPFCNSGECGGCTDENAPNYDSTAYYDDGSCSNYLLGCTDEGACNFNSNATLDDNSCDFESCAGCTDEEAFNFCAGFTIDDGTCIYNYIGCSDSAACNFLGSVVFDDGTCLYLDECGVCGGDGILRRLRCDGNQLDALGECGGPCEADADADGICDDVDPCVGELDAVWHLWW